MNVIFFDDNEVRKNLLPLTYTRTIAHLRVGITTIGEKWQQLLKPNFSFSYLTATYLTTLFPAKVKKDNLMIASNVIPSPHLAEQVMNLKHGEALLHGEMLVAFRGSAHDFDRKNYSRRIFTDETPIIINYPFDIFEKNGEVLKRDFALMPKTECAPLSKSCTLIGDENNLFIEPGAIVEGATINTKEGPVYIAAGVEVMEGACIRGPFSALEGSQVKMGAKVYGATSLGKHCKIGGEVANVVFIGYSNKAHEGFLGNAVIGEWCNLGGGTTASNLKNDYGEIKLWNYAAQRFVKTGRQFCGPILGDHCKTGINSMLNTATVLGVGVNIHGAGFPRNFVPSFMEGNSTAGFKNVDFETFISIATRVMSRRHIPLTPQLRDVYNAIYSISDRYK